MSAGDVIHFADGVPVKLRQWPGNLSSFPDLCGDVTQLTTTHSVIHLAKDASFPLATAFTDGKGVEHKVYIVNEEASPRLLIPAADETKRHIIHSYKSLRWSCQDIEETIMVDANSLVIECVFTYIGQTLFRNHGVRLDVSSYGLRSGDPFPWNPMRKASQLWELVHAQLKLPQTIPESEPIEDPQTRFEAFAENVDLEENPLTEFVLDMLQTYSGEFSQEAKEDPRILANLETPSACLEKVWVAWRSCQEKMKFRTSEPIEDLISRSQQEASKQFLTSLVNSDFGWDRDRLQSARRARIALLFANQVGVRETVEYKSALDYYQKIMLLPPRWPVEDLVIQGTHVAGFAQGRIAPGMVLMRQIADVVPLQGLYDACHKTVYSRDRSGGTVPSRLKVERVIHCINDQVMRQYSEIRKKIRSRMEGLHRSAEQREALGMYTDAFKQEFTAEDLVTTQHLRSSDTPSMLDMRELDVDICNETFLFHGTTAEAVDSITKHDFRLRLAGSGAGMLYGPGVYLAQNPTKSDEYCTPDADGLFTMLLCRVLLGRIKYTAETHPDTSKLEIMAKSIPTAGGKNLGFYQSVLGDREQCRGTFKEVVVFDCDLVYPEFVVKYKRVYDSEHG